MQIVMTTKKFHVSYDRFIPWWVSYEPLSYVGFGQFVECWNWMSISDRTFSTKRHVVTTVLPLIIAIEWLDEQRFHDFKTIPPIPVSVYDFPREHFRAMLPDRIVEYTIITNVLFRERTSGVFVDSFWPTRIEPNIISVVYQIGGFVYGINTWQGCLPRVR